MAQWVKDLPIMQKTQEMFDPWVGKMSWRRKRQPTPVFLPEKSCEQRNLVDYSLKGHKVRLNWATKHTHVFQGLSSLTRNWTRTLAMNVQRWTREVPDNSIFNFLRNCHTVFQSWCTILHFYQQCTMVPTSQHTPQIAIFCFLIIAILIDVKWYLTVILICIPLLISDVEHQFKFSLATCISSLDKCLFNSFVSFKICFFLLLLSCGN